MGTQQATQKSHENIQVENEYGPGTIGKFIIMQTFQTFAQFISFLILGCHPVAPFFCHLHIQARPSHKIAFQHPIVLVRYNTNMV